MLPCVYSVIDQITSSVIYYWSDIRPHEIYLLSNTRGCESSTGPFYNIALYISLIMLIPRGAWRKGMATWMCLSSNVWRSIHSRFSEIMGTKPFQTADVISVLVSSGLEWVWTLLWFLDNITRIFITGITEYLPVHVLPSGDKPSSGSGHSHL